MIMFSQIRDRYMQLMEINTMIEEVLVFLQRIFISPTSFIFENCKTLFIVWHTGL